MNKIVIQYQTHQVLTNKNSLTSENRNATQTNNTQPNNTEQTLTQELKINLENLKRIMNGEVLAKEGKFFKNRQRLKNTDKTGHSKTTKRNSTYKWGEMTRKYTNNRMQEKPNNFEQKYSNQENIIKKPNGYAIWQKKLGLEEGPKAEMHIDLLKTTQKQLNWKTPGHDGIHGFLFKKLTFIHDRLALEMNRYLQEEHVPE